MIAFGFQRISFAESRPIDHLEIDYTGTILKGLLPLGRGGRHSIGMSCSDCYMMTNIPQRSIGNQLPCFSLHINRGPTKAGFYG
jgi:hypothetical protein